MAKTKAKQVHVSGSRSEGYKVTAGDYIVGTAATKKEAVTLGKEVAQLNEAELFIHGVDGKIKDKNSYGNDPIQIPG